MVKKRVEPQVNEYLSYGFVFLIIMLFSILLVALKRKSEQEIALKNRQVQMRVFDKVEGKIINAKSRAPMSKVLIKFRDSYIQSDDQGRFSLENVYENESISVESSESATPLNYTITAESIEILLDKNLFAFLDKFVLLEKQRKYQELFNYLSPNIKNKYTTDDYVKQKNEWRDKIVDENSYKDFNMSLDYQSIKFDEDHLSFKAIYSWTTDFKNYDHYLLKIDLIFQNNKWLIDHNLIW